MGVAAGQVLLGKYRVERVLGHGGMGIVVAARHLQLDEQVAIKLMLPEVVTNSDAVARFVREARASARIKSEHVARVSDVGVLDGGEPYMVMEYLEGQDLSSVLQSKCPLPPAEAVEYVVQACEGIAEAHAMGIVHRDLKPANLFLLRRRDGSPLVKVLDFGISKASAGGQPDGALTRTTALMGSPLYMSPEQMTSSRDVDARTDIWALGVILYELVSGGPPFNGDTLPQVCALVMEANVPPLRPRLPNLPDGFEAVISRCLTKAVDQRFQSVAELVRALTPFAPRRALAHIERISGGFETDATAYVPSSAAGAPSATAGTPNSASGAIGAGTNATWAETRPPAPSRRSPWLLGAVAAGAALTTGAFLLLRPELGESGPSADVNASAASTPLAPTAATPTPSAPPPSQLVAPIEATPALAASSSIPAAAPPAPAALPQKAPPAPAALPQKAPPRTRTKAAARPATPTPAPARAGADAPANGFGERL